MSTAVHRPEPRSREPGPSRPGRSRRGRGAQGLAAFLFTVPALGFYLVFLVVPLVLTIVLSFADWDGYSFDQIEFSGLANYAQMLDDEVFFTSVRVNLIIVVIGSVAKVLVSLVLAIVLSGRIRFAKFLQAAYLMPVVISLVVSGVVFSLAFNPELGFVNQTLDKIGLGALAGDWLGDPLRALLSVITVEVWSTFGIYVLIFVAAIAGIPAELREAARLDGADRWREHIHVVLPMLRPAIGIVALLSVIETLKVFGTIFVMTKGGPDHATEVLSTWGYFQAFSANNVGYGTAIMVVLLLATFGIALLQVMWNRRTRDELY